MNLSDVKTWTTVLDSLSAVGSVLNPPLGSGLKLVSQVVSKFDDSDEVLENNVIGLIRTSEMIVDTVNNITITQDEKNKRLLLLAKNIDDLAELNRKHNLIMR